MIKRFDYWIIADIVLGEAQSLVKNPAPSEPLK
jgi:hypothetical protein